MVTPCPGSAKQCLGATIDHHLCWRPHVKKVLFQTTMAQQAVHKLVAGVRGCLPELAVCIYQATGTSRIIYALPQAIVTPANLPPMALRCFRGSGKARIRTQPSS